MLSRNLSTTTHVEPPVLLMTSQEPPPAHTTPLGYVDALGLVARRIVMKSPSHSLKRSAVIGGLAVVIYSAATAGDPKLLHEAVLPPTSLEELGATAADVADLLANGFPFSDRPAIGSGLQSLGGNRYLGITDRGPTLVGPSSRRILPMPGFTPAIVTFRAIGDRLELVSVLPLVGMSGDGVTGLTTGPSDEVTYANAADAANLIPLPFNESGLDPEGVHTLPGGGFLAVEEYSPSIVVIAADGTVLKRYTPFSKPLPGADYTVSNTLPDVLRFRRNSRGIEGIAVSPDGNTAYAVVIWIRVPGRSSTERCQGATAFS